MTKLFYTVALIITLTSLGSASDKQDKSESKEKEVNNHFFTLHFITFLVYGYIETMLIYKNYKLSNSS